MLKGKKNKQEVNSTKKNILGNYLKNLREHNNVSQVTLSEQIDITNAFINYIETGSRMPSLTTLEKYALFFEVDFNHLKDLREKQVLLNEASKKDSHEPLDIPEPIQKLTDILLKVEKPLLDNLITSFTQQVNELLINMTPSYSLTDLREKYKKVLAFENIQNELIVIEGFLNLPEDTKLFFKFQRNQKLLSLELLQVDRNRIDLFEKWIGPHVFSYLNNVRVPQIVEKQKGVSFCWFSPNTSQLEQLEHLVNQKLDIDSVLFNSSQLAWFIQQNYEEFETEEDVI